jgi:hypothetical protein
LFNWTKKKKHSINSLTGVNLMKCVVVFTWKKIKDTEVVCPHCKRQWKLQNILLYFLISCWLFNIDNYLNRILYSNHQLHTSLKSQQNHIKKPVNMPSIVYLSILECIWVYLSVFECIWVKRRTVLALPNFDNVTTCWLMWRFP